MKTSQRIPILVQIHRWLTARTAAPVRLLAGGFLALGLLALSSGAARASQAYGSINNFDCVNDTGVPCHGFEIELDDIHSTDISYTFNWNHYGTPKITEDTTSVPGHTNVIVRYAGVQTNGVWSAYTAVPAGPIAPTQGHQFTDPSVNFGGEHFGVGYLQPPSAIKYHWLVDNGAGVLVFGGAVNLATPTFTYVPPAAGVPAQVQAVIVPPPPPAPDPLEFGAASWVKEIRTTTHNNNEVKLRDLVSDDPDDPNDRNWRNGEPDEVEVEWQLLQTDYNATNGGANGHLAGAPENLPGGDEVITRRYEFYKYVGPFDDQTGEAMADRVGPDGTNGVGITTINGVEVDLSTVVVVGDYLGSQMSAFDVDAPVGLIDHLDDGEVDLPYTTRTVVIAGNAPFTATTSGALPDGMTFDPATGEVSGTPVVSGVFSFTVHAADTNNPVISKTYTFAVTEPGVVLPPHCTVDTSAAPDSAGSTTGDGLYTNGTTATVMATPSAGFAFVKWTDNGKPVSSATSYTFTNIVNRSLVASFVPAPQLYFFVPQPNSLVLAWPTNFTGFLLQQNPDLATMNWSSVTNASHVAGTNYQVLISPLTGSSFFRLRHP
jgi:hypothetical protein